MKTLIVPALTVVAVLLSAGPSAARRSGAPAAPLRTINRSLSLSAPVTTPLQQQIQNDYTINLMSAQRERLQQNPSGTTRQERALSHALNGFSPQ